MQKRYATAAVLKGGGLKSVGGIAAAKKSALLRIAKQSGVFVATFMPLTNN